MTTLSSDNPGDRRRRLRDAADLCVVCGQCLPHCPTYGVSLNEADSPRGRISLIRALATGQLEADDSLRDHLDGCLACRACESYCPSRVPYGELIAGGRALLRGERPADPPLAARLLPRRGLMRGAARVAGLYRDSGLQRIARASGLLKVTGTARLDALLPPATTPITWTPAALPADAPRVALFRGCVADAFDRATGEAARMLLNRLGVAVSEPVHQTCCGAPGHYHGATDAAAELAQRNLEAFAADGAATIVTTASGCGAQLADYPRLYPDRTPASWRVTDISSYLAGIDWPEELTFAPTELKVAVHAPCSLRNVMHAEDGPLALLRRVPGLELTGLAGPCCGGAGSYMVEQPEMADALRRPLVERIRALAPDVVVTSNIGCSLHVGAGLREAGLATELLHPVTLLARLLAADPVSPPR